MKCPYCGKEMNKVIDSRQAEENSIRRRRECVSCGKRYTTYERIENIDMMVIKKDKKIEPYDRNKIRSSIIRSCHKRTATVEEIDKLVDGIENKIFNMYTKEVPAELIGNLVMDALKNFDSVAYVRFASVYREFKDVNTFMDEIKSLLENKDENKDENKEENK